MLPEPDATLGEAAIALVRKGLDATGGLFVLGICGAQGSGKSTLAAWLAARLASEGVATAVLSLDDLYLTHSERQKMAREVHPLFATRGVPGTHDVALGLRIIDQLAKGHPARLPHFDKSRDDRSETESWPTTPANCRVLLLEGWCVGAVAQPEEELALPVNALESADDPQGLWRRHANACLAGDYQRLFARIDARVMLAAPSFAVVSQWRMQQERDLPPGPGVMDELAISYFIQFYQRLTEWILREMHVRADLVVRLDELRKVQSLT